MTRDVLDSKFKRPKSHGMVYYYYPYLKGLFGWFDSMFQARSPRFPPDFGELSRPHFFLPFFFLQSCWANRFHAVYEYSKSVHGIYCIFEQKNNNGSNILLI